MANSSALRKPPAKKALVDVTLRRATLAAKKKGTTVGMLTRELVGDNRILADLEAGDRSISLDTYERLHDGFSSILGGAA